MQCLPLPPDEVHKHCARQWVTMFEFIVFTVRIRMRRQTKFIEARNTLNDAIIFISQQEAYVKEKLSSAYMYVSLVTSFSSRLQGNV